MSAASYEAATSEHEEAMVGTVTEHEPQTQV